MKATGDGATIVRKNTRIEKILLTPMGVIASLCGKFGKAHPV